MCVCVCVHAYISVCVSVCVCVCVYVTHHNGVNKCLFTVEPLSDGTELFVEFSLSEGMFLLEGPRIRAGQWVVRVVGRLVVPIILHLLVVIIITVIGFCRLGTNTGNCLQECH